MSPRSVLVNTTKTRFIHLALWAASTCGCAERQSSHHPLVRIAEQRCPCFSVRRRRDALRRVDCGSKRLSRTVTRLKSALRLALASRRPDTDRHGGQRLGPAVGRHEAAARIGGRGLDAAGREALARRRSHREHDPLGHPRTRRRQGRNLDGVSDGGAIRELSLKGGVVHPLPEAIRLEA